MARLGDDDFDEGVETFWRLFAANLGEIAKQKTITLWFPRVEFTGGSAAGYDLDITGWRGSIAMYVEADGGSRTVRAGRLTTSMSPLRQRRTKPRAAVRCPARAARRNPRR